MQPGSYQFGHFELDPVRRLLRADGEEVQVTPRAFDLLVALLERAGQLVTKNELLDLVWPNLVVEENNLQVQVSTLRKLLGAHAIATIPGRGYKLTLLPGDAPERATLTREEKSSRTAPLAPPSPGNLPAVMPPLYGRAKDVDRLIQLLGGHRLVSVAGPAGIGKTRVAQAVAHALNGSIADGVWLVELAPLSDPELVAPTVARTLGLPVGTEGGAVEALLQLARDQRLLLVLDNCEHLLDAVAHLARRIVAGCAGVQMLVTSQEPLHVAEEQLYRLDALQVPAVAADAVSAVSYGAVELFVARAQAADPRFCLASHTVADVVEICRRLDGIALAIELAAARVALLGVQGLRRRLDERLNLLAGGERAALPRHQALRAAMQWSYSLLSSAEQTVFDRLGVFPGSFSLEAAQLVAADKAIDAWAVLDHLASLVDKSLVLIEPGDPPRYRLLESSRAFALERLAAMGSLGAARERHAHAVVETLMGQDPFESPTARSERIAPELDNVRAAATWALSSDGDHQFAVALAGATDLLWDAQGCNDEGYRLYLAIEPWVDESTPAHLAARFWFAVSNLRLWVDLRHQADAGLKSVELFRATGDRFWLFRALQSAALKLGWLRDQAGAQRCYAEMAELLDPDWPVWLRGSLEYGRGSCAYFAEDDPAKACVHLAAAIDLHRCMGGDRYFAEASEQILCVVDLALGNNDSALRRCDDMLAGSGGNMGRSRDRAIVLACRGGALTRLGHIAEAEAVLRSAVPQLVHSIGPAFWSFCYAAYLCACQARLRDATRITGYVDGLLSGRAPSVNARNCYEEALALARSGLDVDELERLRVEGRKLTSEEAIAIAFPAGA